MATAQTRQTSKFSTPFGSQVMPHSYNQINFAAEEFNKTSLDSFFDKAWGKIRKQTTGAGIAKDEKVTDFLSKDFKDTNEFKALASEYTKLKKLQGKPHITAYIKAAERIIESIDEKFGSFLAEQKRQFNEAYEASCKVQHERDALWKKHEKNLRTEMLGPVDKFADAINRRTLLSNSMIHLLNQGSDDSTATFQKGKTEEKFIPQSSYQDSKGKQIDVQYDKNTGKVTEMRVDPSGDYGDAYAIAVASHGKDVPLKIQVPISQSDYIRAEMDPGLTKMLVILIFWLLTKGEQNHYKNSIAEAAVEKGISLDNISLVDPNGESIVFSPKLRAKVKEKLEEWEERFAKHEANQEAKLTPQTHLVTAAA